MADGQMRYALFFTADAKQATAAAAQVEAALESVSAETRSSAAAATQYSQAVEQSATQARAAAMAAQGAGVQLRQVGAQSALSAAQVGNLTAQFNDIGVMLAAGQSPLQLAVQQGTQITQVIGPMGARGAVRALGTAFMGLLSPVNLVTIGSIAAGAAMVQWLSGMNATEDAAADAQKRFEDLSAVIDGLRDVSQASSADIESYLRETFSGLSSDVQRLIEDLRDAEFSVISREVRLEIEEATADLTRLAGAFDVFTAELMAPGSVDSGYLAQVNAVIAAAQMSLPEFDRLQAKVQRVFAAQDVSEFIGALAEARSEAQSIGGPVGDKVAAAILKAAEDAGVLNRVLGEASGSMGSLTNEAGRLADQLQRAVDAAFELSTSGGMDLQRAEISYQFRDDPVARARALARAEFDARTEALDGADSTITNVVDAERRAYVAAAGAAEEYRQKTIAARKAAQDAGQAGRATQRQRESVMNLIAGLEDELKILRVTDPVAREMIALREQMAGATDAERAKIEQLVRARQTESDILARQQQAWESWGQVALASLNDVDGALEMVLRSLQQAAFLGTGPLGFLFGGTTESGAGGLLGMVFGGGRAEGGPISGPGTSTSDDILIRASDGEYMVNAASTARYRPVLEAINADKTGSMLKTIIPGRATGGIVTGGAAMPRPLAVLSGHTTQAASAAPASLSVSVRVEGAVGDRDLEARAMAGARAGIAQALADYDAVHLPLRIREITDNPERIG